MQRTSSQRWLERAQVVTPGGVNSPVRAFRAVGGHPVFFVSGQGPYVTDVDGKKITDEGWSREIRDRLMTVLAGEV